MDIKITGNFIDRGFCVEINGKSYYAHFINADYPALALSNRNYIEVADSDGDDAELTEEEEKELNDLISREFFSEDLRKLVKEGLEADGIETAKTENGTTYLGVISHFGEADSNLVIISAKSEAEAYREAEEHECTAIVRLDESKKEWLRNNL